MIGAGDRGGVSADRGCKLLAMLAWLIISVPRAPKGSSRFRSSSRNFWPVANALRPGGKHKIPQTVSGLRNGIMPAAAGRRGGCSPPGGAGLDPRNEGPQLRHNSLEIDYTPRSYLASRFPSTRPGCPAKRRHDRGLSLLQRRGRPGDVRRSRPAQQARKTAATRSAAGSGGDGSVWRIWSRWTWRVRARGVSALEAARAACSCRSRPQGPSVSKPFSRYSFTAMKPTTFDSSCICRMILPTSSRGSLASDSRMR